MTRTPHDPYNPPRLVPRADLRARRAAAVCVWWTYLTHPAHFTLFGAGGVLVAVLIGWANHLSPALIGYATPAAFLIGGIYQAAGNAALTYLAPAQGKDLWLYESPTGGRAAMFIAPDRRRGAATNDRLATTFGAWPRDQRNGSALGDLVHAHHRAQNLRLTGTALPGAARLYERKGMRRVGRLGFLVRVADPHIEPSTTPARPNHGALTMTLVLLAAAVVAVASRLAT